MARLTSPPGNAPPAGPAGPPSSHYGHKAPALILLRGPLAGRLGDRNRLLLLGERLEQAVVGVRELADALLLELLVDLALLDAQLGQAVEDVLRAVEVVVDADPRDAVVLVRLESLARHRVDAVGGDQGLDVVEVGIGGVLGRGPGAQRPLAAGALLAQRGVALAAAHLLPRTVRPAGG